MLSPKISEFGYTLLCKTSILLRCCHRCVSRLNTFEKNSRKLKFGEEQQVAGKMSQKFSYLLVLDFEATCVRNGELVPQEIIEFPCLKLNTDTLQVESQFHRYVQPTAHPQLTSFCTELTGIVQGMVDGQPHLEEVLLEFEQWLRAERLLDAGNAAAFVTCGNWDIQSCLAKQCKHLQIELPIYFSDWINLKQIYFRQMGVWPASIKHMLELLNIKHLGRLHSGIDDAKNLVEVIRRLILVGQVFDITSALTV